MTTPAPETDLSDPIQAAIRCSRSVQTTIGWIFWDPGAVGRYAELGLPGPVGYIAARAAPLAPAGPDAVIAAFGSISPAAIRFTFDTIAEIGPHFGTSFDAAWVARDEAVVAGLAQHAPDIVEPLTRLGPELWPIVAALPTVGRTFFAAHLRMPRPEHPLLSGWHAVNCLRGWRGDSHWALVVAAGLTGVEASILHNAWLGYEEGWLPRSRGSSPEEIEGALASLEAKGLAADGLVTPEGVELRRRIEADTDRLTTLPWELLGPDGCRRFAEELEPPCELLLRRVDETAGPNYQPASRLRPPSA
ncbi:MAG TPA: hypothetical protein PKE56_14710 [Acidimicrobiales bacterium]|nr:hypothetical protein [Acidimicrobiales bacterium]